ncbi:hypothetical protein PHYBOEH_005514 [Phytophthora boehmeriae]|uniref:Uncharacterized protein n=1 Tax=Phytophthora boehmeriae TaxID=109152 RepID=A0A8T1X405_9STRA|nr:hypothetical protein PHYBOEH_005514 [Phytophthora boehmeriae]
MTPSSNQLTRHSNDFDSQFSAKANEALACTSPEFEDSSNDSDFQLAHRCSQLQKDVEVLASHMESQERTRDLERETSEKEMCALHQENAALTRELTGLRIEGDALRKRNMRLATQLAEDERQAKAAKEAHEELMLALTRQQQQHETLQAVIASGARDCAEMRKTLDRAQMNCRRLEEELSAAHTQILYLQNERNSLKSALEATTSGTASYEARQMRLQDEIIVSLRADLVQMEFELKTLSVDKASLADQVDKLHRRVASTDRSSDYEVVPLENNSTLDVLTTRKGQKKRTTTRPVKAARDGSHRRGSDLFSNMMELPNTIREPEAASATIWLSPSAPSSYFASASTSHQNDQDSNQSRSFRERIAPPRLASFVARTVQTARKHLATPLQTTVSSSHH